MLRYLKGLIALLFLCGSLAHGKDTIRFAKVNANYRVALEALAVQYEELHPGVEVELTIVAEEFATWIRTRMAAGGAMVPDIYNASYTGGYGELGRWVDLAPYLAEESPYTGEPWEASLDKRFQPIMDKLDGIAYECHQFNRHWPLETGWSKPAPVIQGAKWTLAQGKEYIFYYGPIIWTCHRYYEFIERDWLETYWKAGLPKHHPNMHYYLNIFPHETGRMRPVGPESDPHSKLGFTKWLIEEIKMKGTK